MTTWRDIPGWSCARTIELYDDMAKELKPGAVAVECGVAYGKSLAYLASVLDPGVDILAVDIWATFQGRTTYRDVFVKARQRYIHPLAAARSMVRDTFTAVGDIFYEDNIPKYDRIEWVQQRSEDVPKYLDFDVDFVFLDDHHEEESVYAEIKAWLPKLKSGGVIAGHDVNDHYPGVERAVRKAFSHSAVVTNMNMAHIPDTVVIMPPHESESGWGGTWRWRKP